MITLRVLDKNFYGLLQSHRQNKRKLVTAFNLYCKIPFGKTVKINPEIIKIAQSSGRTPSSVALKFGIYGGFDPELKIRRIVSLKIQEIGLKVWDGVGENWESLTFESEQLISEFRIRQYDPLNLSRFYRKSNNC